MPRVAFVAPLPRPEPISFANTESMTKQSFADDANINNIMAKYIKTGVMPSGDRPFTYGDFTDGTEYRDIMDRVATAEDEFSMLDSEVRKRFLNDPSVWLDFVADPANAEELKSILGIESAAPAPVEPVAPVIDPPSEPTNLEPPKE